MGSVHCPGHTWKSKSRLTTDWAGARAGTGQEEKKDGNASSAGGLGPAAFRNLEKDLMPRAGPFQLPSPAAPVTSGPFVGVSNAVLKKTRSCSLGLLLRGRSP